MSENIAITVAIPVYNVEKYLKRCLDSIVHQIEKYNGLIEILLVDDGSTDDSLEICKSYSEKWSFIRVIHQANHGLAFVRNICIDNANGKYLSFIDSDDFVLDRLYDYAIKLSNNIDFDILCFKHIDVYGEESINLPPIDIEKNKFRVFNSNDALNVLFFDNYIDVITCNKIIKKSMFEGIRYPVGKLYEDMYTTYKYISKANYIVSIDIPFYVYCHRIGSIGQSSFNEKSMDLFEAAKLTYEYICDNCQYHDDADVGFLYWTVVVINMMIKANYIDDEFFRFAMTLSQRNYKKIKACELLSKVRKFELILVGKNISLYKMFYRLYMKFIRVKMM